MTTKKLAPWMLLGFLLAACGGEGDEDKAVCGNGIVEAGEECDRQDESCQQCKIAPGWECPEDGDCYRVEICDNGEDDTGNGLTDCEDPSCDTHPACVTECRSQAECSTQIPAVEICAEGLCRAVATYDENGKPLVGEVGLFNQFKTNRTNVSTIRSYSIEYFHPVIPGSSERLTCERLAEMARFSTLDVGALNRIRFAPRSFSGTEDSHLLRDSGVLVTSDVKWVVLTRFFEGPLSNDSNRVTGRMLAFSCIDGLDVLPGSWDDSRLVAVDVQPTCETNDHCAEGWTCMAAVGICAYRQCEPACDARGYTCRELDGEPVCLLKCSENKPCPPGHRCDISEGWEPACYPTN